MQATVDRRAHMADDVGAHGSFPHLLTVSQINQRDDYWRRLTAARAAEMIATSANAVLGCALCPFGNLFHQFGQELFEAPMTDERRSGDLGKPPFDLGPLICLARVGVTLGEIAGVAGQHAVAPAVPTSPCEGDEMVDAGLDLAARLYPGETNVTVGASSAPIEIAALVDHVGHYSWLFPRIPSSNIITRSYIKSALKTAPQEKRRHPVSARWN